MKEVMKCTQDLIKAIQDHKEYKSFLKIKEEVNTRPEMKKQLNDFRRRNYELQNTGDSFEMYPELEQLEIEYQELRKNPISSEYLRAELAVCRLLQKVNQSIMASVDIEIEDFADSIIL